MTDHYSKQEGKRELKAPIPKYPTDKIKQSELEEKTIPSSYTKEDGFLDPSLFVIVSGGEVREKDYFDFFQRKYKELNRPIFPKLRIKFIAENSEGQGGLDVTDLVDAAIDVKKHLDESKDVDLIDSINLVTDVDEFYDQIIERYSDCQENHLNLVISNPCFELWLYYSYFAEKPDYIVPEDVSKISGGFKTYLGEKKAGGVDPRKAPFEIAKAINNSKGNFSKDANDIPNLFSTNMHELAEKLDELIFFDLEIYKKKMAAEREKFMNKKS
ncbi:RloB family protein [Labilibaculum sp.]|uniref:RloB family protein n=1 Tax=Labilibaculum sp. TaxID=2060723 RepID=UPI0035672F59